MAKERNSDKPVSPPEEQDFVELKWESNALLLQANRNKVRYLVESDSLKSLVMFNGNHEKPSTDESKSGAANSMKIVNFPHLARLAAQFDLTRQGSGSNGVAIGSLDRCQEIRSNKRVSEEVGNRESNKKMKMKMKIDEENINVENINVVPADEHSQTIAGDLVTEFDDHRLASVADSNNANSGCSSEDEHGKMEADASTTVDNKRSRNAHYDQRKRKDKMKKKILALQELLPGCNKVVDKASVLDEAIEYVKTLQHQLQVMSIPHLFTPIPMMIPFVTSQLIMPTLNQFSPQLARTGMGLGMGSGFSLGPVPISAQVSGMPGFAPMPCVMPYGPGVGEGAGTNLVGRWRTTSFDHHHHQLGSCFVPPSSSYNDSSKPEDFCENRGLVPKPKDK